MALVRRHFRILAAVALTAPPVLAARAQVLGAGGSPAQDAESIVLPDVLVTAPGASTSFNAPAVRVSPFGGASQLDTPITVNTIPRSLLQAQGAESLYGGLRNVAGVTRAQLNGATYDILAVRGIQLENRTNYLLNGALPVVNLIDLPVENRERIEVLKGASALTYGFATPSGIVNLTNLRATAEPVTTLTGTVNNYGGATTRVDIGRMTEDGKFGLRLNALGGSVATGIRDVDGGRGFVSLAGDWRPTDAVTVSLDAEYIRKDVAEPAAIALLPAQNGRIVLPPIPKPTRNLAGGWQRYDAEALNLLARAEWRFAPGWQVSVDVGQARTTRDRAFSQFQNYDIATGAGQLLAFLTREQDYRNRIVRSDLVGAFRTGPVEHEVRAGVLALWRDQNGASFQQETFVQNLYSPLPIPKRDVTQPLSRSQLSVQDRGVYVLERASVLDGRIQVIAGGRYDRYESSGAGAQRYQVSTATPSAAGIVKPLPWLSLYASYVEGLEEGGTAPANAVNALEVLPPAVSTQIEAGAKAELLEGRLLLTLARFELNRVSAFTDSNRRFVQDGRSRYPGWEAGIAGEVTPEWAVYATGLLLDAKQERASDPRLIGRRPENTPRLAGSLFVEYRPGFAPALRLNAGVFRVGARPVNNLNQAYVPGYTTLSLGGSYAFELGRTPMLARLNVDNATGERYWNAAGNGLLGVGLPTTGTFSLTARF